jgi:hypothetical protein
MKLQVPMTKHQIMSLQVSKKTAGEADGQTAKGLTVCGIRNQFFFEGAFSHKRFPPCRTLPVISPTYL